MRLFVFLLLGVSMAGADTDRYGAWRFEERFPGHAQSRWEIVGGEWKFENGTLVGQADSGEVSSIRLKRTFKNLTELEVDATLEGDGEGLHILFAGQAFFHYQSGWTGIYPEYEQRHDCPMKANKTTKIRLSHKKGKYELYVDGTRVIEKTGEPATAIPIDIIQLDVVRGAKVCYSKLRVK